eukprot:6203074-Pleurochrysis_carterae.AAC.1
MLLRGTQAANLTLILDALKMGANPNVRDSNGRTPLHFMAGVGLAPACVLLIQFGEPFTSCSYASYFNLVRKSPTTLRSLGCVGADIEAIDGQGLTPVHMAAGYANAQTLKVLIAAGADLTFETPQVSSLPTVVCPHAAHETHCAAPVAYSPLSAVQGRPLDVVKRLGEYQYKEVRQHAAACVATARALCPTCPRRRRLKRAVVLVTLGP